MEEPSLINCPFCGGEAEFNFVDYIGDTEVNYWEARCMNIDCVVQPVTYDENNKTKVEAAKHWNRRA